MKRKELNSFLIETMTLQNELYDFCIECLEHIYPDEMDQICVKSDFEEGIEAMEYNGCIQGLAIIRANNETRKEQRAKRQLEKGE